ncbi:MAG: leucine-rich repeat domain-containing protein, partial [Clostridia bacterium]|nr:leucine-rich repeat domain-containing protein [Clostridia bacterium]
LAGLDPVNDKIVISNLDFSNATFVGVANYSGTDKPTIYFENCIFKGVSTDRDSDKNKVHLYFDHCTLKSFYGSTATMNWCEFGGNDDTDGLNPFQDVTVTNCYVGNKDAVGYEKELHADATQIYGYGPNGKEIIAKNQYYFNFRAEMPSVRYTDSLSYTNSILMISLDYNDADNITFEHCIVNGGGCPIMIFDNPKNKHPGFKMTNILYKDIYYGVVHEYTPTIIGLSPASDVTLENILQTQTLLVGSVWKENGQTHFSVTNDTNEVRQFTVMTDKGTYTFEVNACPLFADLELNQAFSEFPFDVKYSIPEDATWAVCYDSTGGTYQQIRFYNPEGQTVYLDEGRLESWSAATEIYEIDHGRIGENLRWVLTSDGTLTLSVTDKKATTNTPMEGFTAYKNLIRFVKVTPGVTQITASLFFNCVSLESVSLPSTLQSIGTSAFRNCQNLKTINIPYGVTSIGTNAFENCVSLERIVVPSTVTSVGKYVFRGCQSLTEAVFAAKVRSLSSNVFMDCHNLKSLWLTDSIKNLSTNALTNCYALDTLYYAGTAESLASTVGGTLLTKADITYITEQDYAAREDRSLVQREPKKPIVTFSIANKTYDGEPISYSFTTNSDGQVTYKWMRSSVIIDGAPTEVGRYYLVLKIAGTENYQAYVAHYSFFITEKTGIVT